MNTGRLFLLGTELKGALRTRIPLFDEAGRGHCAVATMGATATSRGCLKWRPPYRHGGHAFANILDKVMYGYVPYLECPRS